MKRVYIATLFCLLLIYSFTVLGQQQTDSLKLPVSDKPAKKNWFDHISIRGYVQVRNNELFNTNKKLGCEQCDRSWGGGGGLFLRRLRIIIFGQLSPKVYFYIQPDFASSVSPGSLHFGQIRDAYFDIGLDKKNQFRTRIGQSKIPFGFENLQSSQNRIPMDRNDALNSALSNERDLALLFYFAPEKIRTLFSSLVRDGLKGSGDYGIIGVGIYNGQIANRPELNTNKHVVARLTYPLELGTQIIEPGIQGYSGWYVIPADQISEGTKFKSDRNYLDQRFASTLVLYPKPFGIQAEYNWGKGPEFNRFTDSIETRKLKGGYATLSYLINFKDQVLIPFIRIQHYEGGKKHELDARSYNVDDIEFGIEWQPYDQFELVAQYTISYRRYEDFKMQNNLQKGTLLRIQAQLNF